MVLEAYITEIYTRIPLEQVRTNKTLTTFPPPSQATVELFQRDIAVQNGQFSPVYNHTHPTISQLIDSIRDPRLYNKIRKVKLDYHTDNRLYLSLELNPKLGIELEDAYEQDPVLKELRVKPKKNWRRIAQLTVRSDTPEQKALFNEYSRSIATSLVPEIMKNGHLFIVRFPPNRCLVAEKNDLDRVLERITKQNERTTT